jgi:hypothetical protein
MKYIQLLALACTLVLICRNAGAQPDLSWNTIDCGGETSTQGAYELRGTIGQPDASGMSAGGYDLEGGFWGNFDAAGCGSADFNCDGAVGTDADIEAFFACLSGNCPPPPCTSSADFNADGAIGTDADIEAFFRVLGGGSC